MVLFSCQVIVLVFLFTQGYESENIPGPDIFLIIGFVLDLTVLGGRLLKNWLKHYVRPKYGKMIASGALMIIDLCLPGSVYYLMCVSLVGVIQYCKIIKHSDTAWWL
jgi:hypothetical protein